MRIKYRREPTELGVKPNWIDYKIDDQPIVRIDVDPTVITHEQVVEHLGFQDLPWKWRYFICAEWSGEIDIDDEAVARKCDIEDTIPANHEEAVCNGKDTVEG